LKSGKAWQAQNLLELIHNDLCCINLPSLAGAKYILTFIDHLSRLTWVYFLKNNNHILKRSRNLGHWMKNNVVDQSSA
jgi:hypothetical protein